MYNVFGVMVSVTDREIDEWNDFYDAIDDYDDDLASLEYAIYDSDKDEVIKADDLAEIDDLRNKLRLARQQYDIDKAYDMLERVMNKAHPITRFYNFER